ncbi:MAG: hypothetical protein GQ533_07580 [Methanosarcinaceae archaeon]|nr:hypothetical protein [Methanosarcinaceae archaeon]
MVNKTIYKIIFILLCVIAIEGCVSYSDDETFVMDAESYASYQFTLLEGEYLDVSITTQEGPVDVIILDSNNFFKYDDETSSAEFYEYDDLYENVIAKNLQFIVPTDGEWYLVIENNNNFNVVINVKYEAY